MNSDIMAAIALLNDVTEFEFGIGQTESIIYNDPDYYLYLDDKQINEKALPASDFVLFLEGLTAGFILAKSHGKADGTSEAGS